MDTCGGLCDACEGCPDCEGALTPLAREQFPMAAAIEGVRKPPAPDPEAPRKAEPEVQVFVCGVRWCRKEGQEHSWDGPVVEHADGCGASVTCSGCGIDAMSHSLMVLP